MLETFDMIRLKSSLGVRKLGHVHFGEKSKSSAEVFTELSKNGPRKVDGRFKTSEMILSSVGKYTQDYS